MMSGCAAAGNPLMAPQRAHPHTVDTGDRANRNSMTSHSSKLRNLPEGFHATGRRALGNPAFRGAVTLTATGALRGRHGPRLHARARVDDFAIRRGAALLRVPA